jgi:hypothetical protein
VGLGEAPKGGTADDRRDAPRAHIHAPGGLAVHDATTSTSVEESLESVTWAVAASPSGAPEREFAEAAMVERRPPSLAGDHDAVECVIRMAWNG